MLVVLLSVLMGAGGLAATPSKSMCARKMLARKDCHLAQGPYSLRLLDASIAWTDGTWHVVEKTPLNGEGTEWEKASFEMMAGRPILQLWIWDKGEGEATVQSLHWYVLDLSHRRATQLSEGVVRKRRPNVMEPAAPTDGAANAKPKGKATATPSGPKYLYDDLESHTLSAGKDGVLHHQLGRERKVLEKVSAHKPSDAHESSNTHAKPPEKGH